MGAKKKKLLDECSAFSIFTAGLVRQKRKVFSRGGSRHQMESSSGDREMSSPPVILFIGSKKK